jgi:hypothetical protein
VCPTASITIRPIQPRSSLIGLNGRSPAKILELYRMNAERRQRRTRSWVRLQAPPGIGSVQTLHSCQHLTVGLDGTVEMWAEDAQYYINDGWTKLAEWATEEDATAERQQATTCSNRASARARIVASGIGTDAGIAEALNGRGGGRAPGSAAWRPLRQSGARAPCCNGPVLHAATPGNRASATRFEPVGFRSAMLPRYRDTRVMDHVSPIPRATSQRASQKPSRPASKASAIRVMVQPALTASSCQRCSRAAAVLGSAPASCVADAQSREAWQRASSTGSAR